MRAFILDNFDFKPTNEQYLATQKMAEFFFDRSSDCAFILRGYAGTGKTTLVGALVKALQRLGQRSVLMASTGRAAKVFSLYTGRPATTIHKRIYRQKAFTGEMTNFLQGVNLMKDTLFIVDESSMISNEGAGDSAFGTGRLLDDLVHYVYSGVGCRLMLVGDMAQLPPVGDVESPALSTQFMEGYGLQVHDVTLTQVVRQLSDSGILWNATMLRQLIATGLVDVFPRLRLMKDVEYVSGAELIEALESAYYECGDDQTIIVTRSNVRANAFNRGVRERILGYDSEMAGGDRVVVVKNNYHWVNPQPEGEQLTKRGVNQMDVEDNGDDVRMDFIANGDIAVVRRFCNERTVHGFRFADVTLVFPDFDHLEVDATIILDTLMSEAPALTRQQQEELFHRVWDDYPELTTKRERMKAVREDSFFNALQVKYGYAVTCHKAQGGQWQRVFVDQGFITEEMLDPNYFRWLYTAITRATEKVYLVNWPKAELDSVSQRMLED